MITLSKQHQIKYVAASGAFGNTGKGWPHERLLGLISRNRWFDPSLFFPFAKTFTFDFRTGNFRWYNPLGCIAFIPGGVVNAYGLTNIGRKSWCKKYGPWADSKRLPQGVSIAGTPKELYEMAAMLQDYDFAAIEINASCPNDGIPLEEKGRLAVRCAESVRQATNKPIVFKWSPAQAATVKMIARSMEGLVQAFSVNSVPWNMVFPDKKSPLARLGGGGVSGKAAQKVSWETARLLKDACSVPVIWPSMWDYEDIDRAIAMGADAVSFGGLCLRHPTKPTKFVRRHMAAR